MTGRCRPEIPRALSSRLSSIGAPPARQAVGVNLLLLNMNFGNMTHPEAMRSLRLFGQQVLPAFR